MHRKLQNETFLETLIIKQLVIDNDNAEIIASCVTNVRNVLIESIDLNKKQWVKFAVELNRSDKKIQSLGKSTTHNQSPLTLIVRGAGGHNLFSLGGL